MSEETKLEPSTAVLSGDPLEFYKSLTPAQREMDREFVTAALDRAVFPAQIRYDVFRGGYRGVIKSIDGEFHYFTMPPKGVFHLVKANDETKKWEAQRLFKGCGLGCDLIRKSDDDEDEKEEGKAGAPGGATAELPPASQPEAQTIAAQNAEVTQSHPGAAMGTTPQQDGSTNRWHGTPGLQRALPEINVAVNPHAWDTIALMKAWGQELQETAPRVQQVDPQLKRFCVEVLGKMPSEVEGGNIKLNGLQRAQFNQWLTKSARSRVSGLSEWLQKAGK